MVGAVKLRAQTTTGFIKPVPQIQGEIDSSRLVALPGNVHPMAKAAYDTGVAPPDLALKHMTLVLKQSESQKAALDTLLADQQNPSSASYHHWLSPTEFGSQFGVAEADIQKITTWLESYGFTVESVSNGHTLIRFSGTHVQLQAAFHTQIHSYKVNGVEHWANATDPEIPAAMAPVVAGFSSLNSFRPRAQHTSPRLIRKSQQNGKWNSVPGSTQISPAFSTTDSQGDNLFVISPYDFATIYNVRPLWNAGIDGTDQTIAIISDSNINTADIDYFRSTFGLPAKKLNLFYPTEDPGVNGDEGEADLDVEWSGAVAKNATIDLVVGENTNVSDGVIDAIAYIINNNLAPIMSVSYGACELELGTAGNTFLNEVWQQAAAQGITAMVSSGDAGSAACDQGFSSVSHGLEVSGFASTPYTVTVGGTDYYASFVSPNTYWNTTNDPTTLASALSYIPETTWNNSCANPDILKVLQSNGVTDSNAEALCNDASEQQYFISTVGGGGGRSKCIDSDGDDNATCSNGNPKPEWQTGVPGIPADGVRDLPDISLMSGNGLWGSFYVYCQSDAVPGGKCDVNNALEGAGGTSFASPAFAGIMALAEQKTHSQIGNANYVLYKLAAMQSSDPALGSACQSGNVTTGNSCTFYDITNGTIALPCIDGTANCTASISGDTFGILPGYDAGPGYDVATGLGSVNAYNLVEKWSTATATFMPSKVVLTASSPTTFIYGSNLSLQATVTAQPPATGTPGGDIAVTSDASLANAKSIADATLQNGGASLQVGQLPVGSYNLYARYAGNSLYSPSLSSGVSITVSPATPAASLSASRTTLAGNPNTTTLRVTMTGASFGAAPTGTIVFTDTTTGSALGSASLQQSITVTNASSAELNVTIQQLASGANHISATYSGDGSYTSGNPATAIVTVTPAFAVTANPSSLTLSAASPAQNPVVVTVVPASGANSSAPISFSCPNLPAGLTCVFGPATTGANGAVTSQLTIQLGAPLISSSAQSQSSLPSRILETGTATTFVALLLFGLPNRRRWPWLSICLVAISASSVLIGCGGGGSSGGSGNQGGGSGPTSPTATTTNLAVSSNTPALNGPVTFTAQVSSQNQADVPTGSVTFFDGTKSLGSVSLVNGTAKAETSTLSLGVHSISAQYQGDANNKTSASPSSSVDVTFSAQIVVSAADTLGNTGTASVALMVQ
ncbi:Ig-like domain repeat protein [Acidobacterium sp. S8]|uniref:Ig-like domain repeat protein n=1 Tax=Acidobacterium sp. S8 TaxID=1641854 RepID=UPI0020B1536D|nr:Ig-like domain repeat protein [Acidobacterium sp. S8]